MAEGEAAVVGGDALVPIGAEAGVGEALDRAFGQVSILEAAAGEDDAFESNALSDGEDGFGEAVVEFGGDEADGGVLFEVGEEGVEHGGPVEDEGGMWARAGRRSRNRGRGRERGRGRQDIEGEIVVFVGGDFVEGEFQFHGGLAFEADLLTKACECGNGVEKSSDA